MHHVAAHSSAELLTDEGCLTSGEQVSPPSLHVRGVPQMQKVGFLYWAIGSSLLWFTETPGLAFRHTSSNGGRRMS